MLRGARRTGPALVLFAALLSSCARAPVRPTPAPARNTASAPAAEEPEPTPPPVAPPDAVRVLYHDDWHGSVQLLGIDAEKNQAFLRLESGAPKRLAIDTIDIRAGKQLERWQATEANAGASVQAYPVFRPLTGTFEEDLARFAGLLRASGPWHLRGRTMRPTVAVSGDGSHILYGAAPTDRSDGDWLFMADGKGRGTKRVDTGVRASYAPVFSPDGSRVAWRGCVQSPCGYALFVSRVGGTPERVNAVTEAGPPVWSQDGRFLYTIGHTGKSGGCLYKISADAVWETKTIRCVQKLTDLEFTQDPTGRTGVLAGSRGVAGKQIMETWWILLADGSVLGTHDFPLATGIGVLSDAGILVMPLIRGGIGAVDFVSGKSGVVAGDGWYLGIETTKWLGEWIVLLRRGAEKGFDLCAIDGRETTGARAR